MNKHKTRAELIAEALNAARHVQDYLWGSIDTRGSVSMDHLLRVLRKRVIKHEAVDLQHPNAIVEVRKRLLQTAAVAIAWLERIEIDGGSSL